MVQCQVSVQRIDKFMNANELDPDAVSHDDHEDPIVVRNASFTWGENVSNISKRSKLITLGSAINVL